MITLKVDNSVSHVSGLTDSQFKQLRDLMSYKVDAQAMYHSGNYNSPKRYLLSKRGDFPTGLLYIIENYIKKHQLFCKLTDLRKRPAPRPGMFKLCKQVTPYQAQQDAVVAILARDTGCVSMPTGTGKSLTMVLLVQAMQLKTLIIVPNLGLKKQLTETFLYYFGSLDNITIENVDSKSLKNHKDYDLLIIDESHHVAAKTYRTLNAKAWNKIYHRVFFTATPFRSRDEEQLLMESVCGQVIYRLTYKEAIASNLIVPVEAYYIEVPFVNNDLHTWKEVYSKLVVNNPHRNDRIRELIVNLHLSGVSALCLVKEIQHGEALTANGAFLFANGQNEDTQHYIELFNQRKLNVLIGTTGVLGEGIDSKPCEYVIIAGLGRSRNAFAQQIGRGFRKFPGKESCKIILFKDRSHKFTIRHFNEQIKILREDYGVVCQKIEMNF